MFFSKPFNPRLRVQRQALNQKSFGRLLTHLDHMKKPELLACSRSTIDAPGRRLATTQEALRQASVRHDDTRTACQRSAYTRGYTAPVASWSVSKGPELIKVVTFCFGCFPTHVTLPLRFPIPTSVGPTLLRASVLYRIAC